VPVYTPLLRIERTTRDTTGRVVEVTRSVGYRGDRIPDHLHAALLRLVRLSYGWTTTETRVACPLRHPVDTATYRARTPRSPGCTFTPSTLVTR